MTPPLIPHNGPVLGWGCAAPAYGAAPPGLKGRSAIGSADGPAGRP